MCAKILINAEHIIIGNIRNKIDTITKDANDVR